MIFSKIKNAIRKRFFYTPQEESDATKIAQNSLFACEIEKIFKEIKPTKVIETGTYLGTGTTHIIAKAIAENNIKNCVFYSIEVNPQNHTNAKHNLKKEGFLKYVTLLNGLSVPRSNIPTKSEILRRCVTEVEFSDIYIDHEEKYRVERYYQETNFDGVPDDLIEYCLNKFEYKPEFILLDSAGHMGNIEFNYIISKIKGPCIVALDDVFHIKHHRSFIQMKENPNFEILVSSREKFGFCIAKFSPKN